jgi:CBS-domain-containing membrane protein
MFNYAALTLRPLKTGLRIEPPTPRASERLTLDSRALSVMTDFAVVPAATIEPAASVDDANRFMIGRGVRSLLVIDHAQRVIGMVTASDILGERPMQLALETSVSHAEIPVREVMTPIERLQAVPLEALADAKVGHIVATLRKAGRQHALVVERGVAGDSVRGIFSLSHVASALGINIEATPVAGTFAEVEAALAR